MKRVNEQNDRCSACHLIESEGVIDPIVNGVSLLVQTMLPATVHAVILYAAQSPKVDCIRVGNSWQIGETNSDHTESAVEAQPNKIKICRQAEA